jgi:hypothetical protein
MDDQKPRKEKKPEEIVDMATSVKILYSSRLSPSYA